MTSVRKLVEVSRFYGNDKDFVLAGGGNTSFKDDKFMWIKASGASLCNITEDDFVILDRERLKIVETKRYSQYSSDREKQVRNDLFRACVYPERNLRPSVEASLHEIMNYNYVVHTHPTVVNALMCSKEAGQHTQRLFGDKALYVPYTDRGYALFKKVKAEIGIYREKFKSDPQIILLQNHGILVAADSADEIKVLHQEVITAITAEISLQPDTRSLPIDPKITLIIPAIRMMLTERSPVTTIIRHHWLLKRFYEGAESFQHVSQPLTPEVILYCNSRIIFIEQTSTPENILQEASDKIETFKRLYKMVPKILVLKDIGIISAGSNYKAAKIAMDVFEDQMKISFLSENFGGPRFMNDREINFIVDQVIDNMQRLLSKGDMVQGRVAGKTVVITDVSGIPGSGIAEDMMKENANLVVAGDDEAAGIKFTNLLNATAKDNRAVFVKANVSGEESVRNLFFETVRNFGGVDVLVVCEQGIKGMTHEVSNRAVFRFCTQYASEILKLQSSYRTAYFTDIIKVNAQPGLEDTDGIAQESEDERGSLDLIHTMAKAQFPFHIKVNEISPGNFFHHRVWSDPETGLFQKYLDSGKVPGAKNVDDIRTFYENLIPARRGCDNKDVMRAIYYLIEQVYETGQIMRVTGGLNR